MNTESKKRLATGLMGWELSNGGDCFYPPTDDDELTDTVHIDNYNPDTNPEQFKEVLERLTPEQRDKVENKLTRHPGFYDSLFEKGDSLVTWLWISNHMPEVIEAILSIIPTTKGK